jgi:hypothetical protein
MYPSPETGTRLTPGRQWCGVNVSAEPATRKRRPLESTTK